MSGEYRQREESNEHVADDSRAPHPRQILPPCHDAMKAANTFADREPEGTLFGHSAHPDIIACMARWSGWDGLKKADKEGLKRAALKLMGQNWKAIESASKGQKPKVAFEWRTGSAIAGLVQDR